MRFIALYFALQLLGRVLVSPNLELDEAEQVFLLQNLEFGYGLQPPFYTWLQALFFYAFGPSVFSLSLLKNLLLFGIYASLYWSARQVFEKKQAIAITLGLAFFPQILWEAQRDLSHTVLLSFCIAAFIGMIVKGVKSGFTGPIVVGLALCTAIGIQAKYSFAVFAGAFFLALVSQPESRTLLFSRPLPLARLILFLLVVFVVTFPHGQWLIDNWQVVQEPLRHKVFLQHDTGVGQGLYNLLVASLGFIAFIFISVVLALPIRRGGTFERPLWVKTELQQRVMALLIAYSAALAFVLLALVLLFDVHQIKDRWLQPFLVMLPFLVFLGFPALRSGLEKVWLWGGSVLMLACLILMPSRTLFAEQIGQQSRLNIPHMKLVAAIAHDFPNVEVISLNHQHEAGHFVLFGMQNLRPWKVELADPQGKTFVRRYGFQVENALGPGSVDVVAKEVSGRLTHEYWWDVFQTERGIEIRRVAGYSRH